MSTFLLQLRQALSGLWSRRLMVLVVGLLALGSGLLCSFQPLFAQQAVPVLSSYVLDSTDTLSAEQTQMLETKLSAFDHSRGAQVVLLLVPTTQPEDIGSYANRVANTWKIGRKDIGDGLLVVVAKNDHKIRIEVAKTLEGAIPDLAAKRIIDETMTPRFKQSDFAGGLDTGVDQIMKLIAGEALPAPTISVERPKAGFDWMNLVIFAFIAAPVLAGIARSLLGPKLGSLATGGAIGALALWLTSSLLIASLAGFVSLLYALFSNVGRSSSGSGGYWHTGGSGWGSSAGGGGFSSGGGGDFGGGGASGDW